jgi:hypothetical protein
MLSRTPGNWELLVFWLSLIALALVLQVRPDQRLALRWLPGAPLPETCPWRAVGGSPCPLCGLGTSAVHLAHGEWRASLATHRLGWLVALAVALQVPYHAMVLARPPHRVVIRMEEGARLAPVAQESSHQEHATCPSTSPTALRIRI